MRWFRSSEKELLEAGERARRLHSEWLSAALQSGKQYPKIPVRRVDQGGMDRLTATERGRAFAERWWRYALSKIDDHPPLT